MSSSIVGIIKQIGNASIDSYVLIDSEHRIVWINSILEKKGFSLENVKGTLYYRTFSGRTELDPECSTARAFTNKSVQTKTEQGQDGKTYSVASIPIMKDDAVFFVLEIGRELESADPIPSSTSIWQPPAIENSFDGIFVADKDYRILYVNDAFEKLCGHKSKDFIGEIPLIFQNSTKEPGLYKEFWKAINSGQAWDFAAAKGEGSSFANDMRIIPVRDDLGFNRYYIGIERDLAQLNKLEQTLQQYQAIPESSNTFVVQTDYSGSFTILGSKAKDLLPSDSSKKNISELLGKTAQNLINEMKETGKETLLPRTFTLHGKQFQVTATDVISIKSINFYFSDVSAHQRIEKTLRERNEELEKFYKLAVGRELRMIELKNKIAKLDQEIQSLKKGRD